MKKILIIGGGLSGLSSALYLTEMGYKVEIVEASPKLGGRTYSFEYKGKNRIIDNGQHILMGCYSHTLDYIDTTNSRDKFYFQDSLQINYAAPNKKIYNLSIPEKFYPLNFLYSFMNLKILSFNERREVVKFLFRLSSIQKEVSSGQSVRDLLSTNGQSSNTIKTFWELVVVSAINTPIEVASAELFVEMIKIIFLSGKKSSAIIIPNTGLSEALINPARDLILSKGGEIFCSERVLKIETDDERVSKVITSNRERNDFDYIVSAMPAENLLKIIPENFKNRINIPSFKYSPIISVNLWLDRNPLEEKFYGIIDGEFHWLFNNGEYISLIKSAANSMVDLNENELIETAKSELKKYFTILNNVEFIDSKIIKERKATIISDSNSVKARKNLIFNFNNLFIVGDWINTGLPGTIESSVKSGKMISDMILSKTLK